MSATPAFMPGLILAERFYREAVRPLLDGGLPHAAALIGPGSEVLGFDTPVSTDHHWGPRVQLFLDEDTHAESILARLRRELPHVFLGWPTNFTEPNPADHGTQTLQPTTSGPVNHRVDVLSVPGFIAGYLGYDLREPPSPVDWLTFPSQKLRSIVAGGVFHDDIGLGNVRERFAWYPPDVWRYLLAAGWQRIGQEEHLMGRAGQVGDELGSALIAGRLVRDVMRLCFLMERVYAPYPKWYGTAFTRLECADRVEPLLREALRATTWHERDRALPEAYRVIAEMQNALDLAERQPAEVTRFFDRPFSVIFGERFATALLARIDDPGLRRLPLIGSIDQWSDSPDVLQTTALRSRLAALYRAPD